MSVLELQPQYELQLYKWPLGAAALAGGEANGWKSGGSRTTENRQTERADTFHQTLRFASVPHLTPKAPSFPFVCLLLKYSFFFPSEGGQVRCEGETELCYHSM